MIERFHNLKPLAVAFIIILLSMLQSSEALALSDETIKQQIEAKASDTPELKGTQVRVDVEDGLVFRRDPHAQRRGRRDRGLRLGGYA